MEFDFKQITSTCREHLQKIFLVISNSLWDSKQVGDSSSRFWSCSLGNPQFWVHLEGSLVTAVNLGMALLHRYLFKCNSKRFSSGIL